MILLYSAYTLESYEKQAEGYNRILEMGQEVIRILAGIHAKGYLHCDIKPFNILFDTNEKSETSY